MPPGICSVCHQAFKDGDYNWLYKGTRCYSCWKAHRLEIKRRANAKYRAANREKEAARKRRWAINKRNAANA